MKALKTVIFAATLMSGATAMSAEVSGNVALSSDYFFRGIDQSGGEALSGGFDVAFDSGFYVGTWASSIDFSGGLELDYYAGYGGSFSDDVSFDVGYMYYGYPQGPTTEEFEEFYGSVSFADATVGFAISDDYYASTGSSTYLYLDYGVALSEDFSLGFHYGSMSADDAANEADDYSVSLSTEAAGLGFDLSWIDSSEDGGLFADNEFVLTISKSL
ncbi:MAG: TorF family putative porin [Porticoccaceae bacterium]|nr:TorF family putative porin [Porticoccaceae bacterium]